MAGVRLGGSRVRRLGLVLGLLLAFLVVACLGLWAGRVGPFASKTPQTIYYVFVPPQSSSPSPTATPTPEDTTATSPSSSPSASPTATASAAGPVVVRPKPDLAISGYSNPWLVCGKTFHMSVSVGNRGDVATTRTTTVRLVDRYGSLEIGFVPVTVPILAAHTSFQADWSIAVGTGCGNDHTLVARVDPDNVIDESDEGNNSLSMPYHLDDGPELMTPEVELSPANPACGANFTVSLTVYNYGSKPALDTTVRLVDTWNGVEQKVRVVSFPSLPVEAHTDVTAIFNVATHCGARHRITAYIDPLNRIHEIHEDNNESWVEYTL